jgi:hypothetical protein
VRGVAPDVRGRGSRLRVRRDPRAGRVDLVSSSDEPTLPSPPWGLTPALGSHPLYTKPHERSR